jgi:hypothetical protein
MIFKLLYLLIGVFSFYFIGNIFSQNFRKISNLSNQYITASESIFIGLFLFGSFVFLFNFFYKINSLQFLFATIFILIFFLLQLSNYKINNKHIKNIFIFTLISFPIILSMDSGYDAGLYHVTHQKFIREEKIIFGIANFHNVFGYSSFYEYLSAPLWMGNNLDNLASLQLIFYISLFLFIYEVSKKSKQQSIYALIILFTIPFWLRYAPIKWGLVDFPFGVVFFLSVLTSIFILKNDNKDESKHLFSVLIFLNCLTFFFKPGGFVVGLLTLFVIYILLKRNFYGLKDLIKLLVLPFLVVSLWIFRGFANTSCLLYPFPFSCLNTEWGNAQDAEFNWDITKEWGLVIFEIIQKNINFSEFYLIFILIIFLILIVFFHNMIVKFTFNINFNYFYLVLFFLFIIELIVFNKNTNFARDQLTYDKILIEFIYFISLFVSFYFLLYLFFNFRKIDKKIIDINLFPLFFSLLTTILWLSSAPIPRLGFSFIGCLFVASLSLLKKDSFELSDHKKNIILIQLFIFIITVNYSFFSDYKLKELSFSKILPPKVKTKPRNSFGVKPVIGDQCWDILWCSPLESYPLKITLIKGYKFILK